MPCSYQVVGHFKTCAVIFFGFVWLHQPFDTTNLIGVPPPPVTVPDPPGFGLPGGGGVMWTSPRHTRR